MAGGVIPPRFVDCSGTLDVVDIEPVSHELAKRHFQFSAKKANLYVDDARRYLRNSTTDYDLIIFDVFHGDGAAPEHLLTLQAIQLLAARLTDQGVVIFSISGRADATAGSTHYCFLKTVQAVLPHLLIYHLGESNQIQNMYLAASSRELQQIEPDFRIASDANRSMLKRIFARPQPIRSRSLADSRILTDEFNIYPVLRAREQMQFRRSLIDSVPAPFLVN